MDEHLQELLRAMLEADPDTTLDDNGRQAVRHAMLGLHPSDHVAALRRFAQSIESEFKRSVLLHNLARHFAPHLHLDLAEKIARSIRKPYWRFRALNEVAGELLRRDREFASNNVRKRLPSEIEKELPSIPQDDGDRAAVLWGAGGVFLCALVSDWSGFDRRGQE